MKKNYTILIADRNSHVRELVKREISKEGFTILEAENGKDVIKMVYRSSSPLDLVLIDPDLPDMKKSLLLKKLGDRIPPLPVVIHGFDSEEANCLPHLKQATLVEKGGQSIERLKEVIFEIFEKIK